MLPSPQHIRDDVQRALAEDIGSGDLTAGLIPPAKTINALVVSRESAVLAGSPWFSDVFRQLDPAISVQWLVADSDPVGPEQVLCRLSGQAAGILSGERSALNFLQTLSATATRTAAYVRALAGTGVRILDTRKTLPGLRLAQKYAVTCGGGFNHRIGLYDAILIKENHILSAGSVSAALRHAQSVGGQVRIEVEVEDLGELEEALQAGAENILLDNFSLDGLRQAVAVNRQRARLEASGGVTLETVRAIAETGVDDISVGSLTKDIAATDFSMRFSED